MPVMNTVSVSEARANFTKIGRQVNETRKSVTVFKGSTPYLVISPIPVADTPNAETIEAFRDLDGMRQNPRVKPCESEEEFFVALGL